MPTKISWTDESWNPNVGCKPVSPGCMHCYAARQAHRGLCEAHRGLTKVGPAGPYFNGEVRLRPEKLTEPITWQKPMRIFVPSMGDLFYDAVPFEYAAAVFGVMAAARHHTFQLLTKHPERLGEFLTWLVNGGSCGYVWQTLYVHLQAQGVFCPGRLTEERMGSPWPWPLPNVWLGTSIEGNAQFGRVEHLRKCPAPVRFLSCEPLLERVDITEVLATGDIHWVIAGGESGPNARPCAMEWIEEVVEQCAEAEVPCFVKQLGATVVSEERMADTLEDAQDMCGPDKKDQWLWYAGLVNRAGADPEEWPEQFQVQEFPEVEDPT